MTVPLVSLGEVADVSAGSPAPQGSKFFIDDGEPFVRMQDVGREHHTRTLSETVDKVSAEAIAQHRLRRFPAGTLLIPKSGASINLNHRALLARDAYVVSHLATVSPDASRLLPEYLYFWSLTYDPRAQAQTTSLPSLPTSLIKTAQIPLPALAEQQNIVDLLSRAEGIVRLRREAQAKAAEIIPALFLDMFGDPGSNQKSWPTLPLGEATASIDSGKSPRCHNRQKTGDEWGVLKLSALSGGNYNDSEHKTLPSEITPITANEVLQGDVLISRKNTYELVGTCAYVWETRNQLLLPDLIFRLKLLPISPVEPIYLWQLLSTSSKREALRALAGGSAGSMPNISKARLRNLPIEVPPTELQRDFAEKVEALRTTNIRQTDALATAQATFNSLLYRSFSGA